MDKQKDRVVRTGIDISATTYKDYDLVVMNNIAQIVDRGIAGSVTWTKLIEALPGEYRAGLSQLQLQRKLLPGEESSISVNGTVTINTLDESQLLVDWDVDTIPTNTTLNSPAGRNNTGSIDFIIDPQKYNPTTAKTAGLRLLLLGAINTSSNVGEAGYDGPDAWKNADNTDFVAGENDIVEWDGSAWHVVFDASTDPGTSTKYVTSKYRVQYRWTHEWTNHSTLLHIQLIIQRTWRPITLKISTCMRSRNYL